MLAKEEALKKVQERELAIERRKKQKERELKKYLADDQETNDESHITNYLEILDSFRSKPSVNDKIIGIVPVFAPWSSLQKFKYKVKIQPGSGKKGNVLEMPLIILPLERWIQQVVILTLIGHKNEN